MGNKLPFSEKFIVICVEDHVPYLPLLMGFQYKGRYQAAVHCGGSNCAYKVWYGPDESRDYGVFTDRDFQRWFERSVGATSNFV